MWMEVFQIGDLWYFNQLFLFTSLHSGSQRQCPARKAAGPTQVWAWDQGHHLLTVSFNFSGPQFLSCKHGMLNNSFFLTRVL